LLTFQDRFAAFVVSKELGGGLALIATPATAIADRRDSGLDAC
jgi:hypothetical protein